MDERWLLSLFLSSNDDVPGGENKVYKKDKNDDKSNQYKDKLGRISRVQQQQKCSKYCVRFWTMMKVTFVLSLTSPLSVCLVISLLQFSFGGTVEGVGTERVLQQHHPYRHNHHQHHHANWRSVHNRNSAMIGGSEPRGLDRVLERLEGKGPGGRRERRDYDVGGIDQGVSVYREQLDERAIANTGGRKEEAVDHHHRHSPILPSSSTDTHPQRHFLPAQSSQHPRNIEDDTENQQDDSSDEEDEDYDDNYDDDNLTSGANDKMSHWAENYKSRYLSGKRKTPSSSSTTTTAATTTTTIPTPPPTHPPTYSQWKWQNLGTRQGLDQYRRQVMTGASRHNRNNNSHSPASQVLSPHYHHPHNPQVGQPGSSNSRNSNPENEPGSRTAISEAIRHAMRVKDETECKVPRPKVVHVQDLYPHPSKSYVPHCTILHRCSDDTGCCRQQTETCAPKNTHRVELAFYTISLDQSRDPIVERLVFYNHTECECRDKMDEMMPRDQSQPSYHHEESFSKYSPPKLDSITNLVKVDDRDKKKKSLCKCPSMFSRRPEDACSCDCFDGQMECLQLKRGRTFFTLSDKWCIQSGQCELPECAFGPYIHLTGRCPEKREMNGNSNSWTKYMSS